MTPQSNRGWPLCGELVCGELVGHWAPAVRVITPVGSGNHLR